MANIFQDLFGGSTTSSTSTPVNMNPLTASLAPQVTNAFSSALSNGVPQTTIPTISTTGAQNTSLTNLANAVAPANNVNNYINQVLSGSYMPGQANGPNLTNAINAANLPIQESAQTLLTQANPAQFAAGGQQVQGTGSSAFANAQNLGVQSAVNAESANAANITNNAYNTGISQMTAAAQLQPQEVQSAINVLQAQLLPTLLQEQGVTNGLTAFQDNVTALTSFLSTMSGAISPVVGTSQTSNTTGTNSGIASLGSLFNPVSTPATATGTSSAAGNIFAALASL